MPGRSVFIDAATVSACAITRGTLPPATLATSARPLVAPSANASGRITATRAEHVAASLGDRVPLILDDEPTRNGLNPRSSP
ncbi:Sua5/YciO/YrdC/YwlC family protein [Sphingomonas oryzagri]